jgi:hypothetical protein
VVILELIHAHKTPVTGSAVIRYKADAGAV